MERRALKGLALRASCKALQEAYELMRDNNLDVPADRLDRLLRTCGREACLANIQVLPKFHFLGHIGLEAADAGNPKYYSTYEDEAHNHDIVRIVQSCHVAEFSARLLAKLELLAALEQER